MKTGKVLEVWENVNVILFSFASDWWRGWCEFSGPITEQSLVKNQSRLLFTVNWKLFKICVGQKLFGHFCNDVVIDSITPTQIMLTHSNSVFICRLTSLFQFVLLSHMTISPSIPIHARLLQQGMKWSLHIKNLVIQVQ